MPQTTCPHRLVEDVFPRENWGFRSHSWRFPTQFGQPKKDDRSPPRTCRLARTKPPFAPTLLVVLVVLLHFFQCWHYFKCWHYCHRWSRHQLTTVDCAGSFRRLNSDC